MTGEAIGSAKQQTQALQKIPNGGGRDRKQRINYRQYFAESDESESEDKNMTNELGVSGRERRAAKRENQRWESVNGDESGSDMSDDEEGESESSEDNV